MNQNRIETIIKLEKSIKEATSDTLLSVNIDKFNDIANMIFNNISIIKEAVSIMKERLLQKNEKVILYCFELFEFLLCNCDDSFNYEVHDKDFLKVINGFYNQRIVTGNIKQKVNYFVQFLHIHCNKNGKYPNFERLYLHLKKKGITFPIYKDSKYINKYKKVETSKNNNTYEYNTMPKNNTVVTDDINKKRIKLAKDLDVVFNNMDLANSLITVSHLDNVMDESLKEIMTGLKNNYNRFKALIEKLSNSNEEELLMVTLNLNEDLLHTFGRYKSLVNGNKPKDINYKYKKIIIPEYNNFKTNNNNDDHGFASSNNYFKKENNKKYEEYNYENRKNKFFKEAEDVEANNDNFNYTEFKENLENIENKDNKCFFDEFNNFDNKNNSKVENNNNNNIEEIDFLGIDSKENNTNSNVKPKENNNNNSNDIDIFGTNNSDNNVNNNDIDIFGENIDTNDNKNKKDVDILDFTTSNNNNKNNNANVNFFTNNNNLNNINTNNMNNLGLSLNNINPNILNQLLLQQSMMSNNRFDLSDINYSKLANNNNNNTSNYKPKDEIKYQKSASIVNEIIKEETFDPFSDIPDFLDSEAKNLKNNKNNNEENLNIF